MYQLDRSAPVLLEFELVVHPKRASRDQSLLCFPLAHSVSRLELDASPSIHTTRSMHFLTPLALRRPRQPQPRPRSLECTRTQTPTIPAHAPLPSSSSARGQHFSAQYSTPKRGAGAPNLSKSVQSVPENATNLIAQFASSSVSGLLHNSKPGFKSVATDGYGGSMPTNVAFTPKAAQTFPTTMPPQLES